MSKKRKKQKKKRQEEADEITNFAKTATSNFFWNHKKKLDEQIFDLKERLPIKTNDNNKLSAYRKLDITNGSGFKTSYGSTGDTFGVVDKLVMNNLYIDKIIKEINSINQSFEELVNEYRNRVKDTDKDLGENNIKSQKSSIKVLKSSIDWLISSMKDILKDSKNQYVQMKK